MGSIPLRVFTGNAAPIYDQVARSRLFVGEPTAEFIDVIICLGKEGFPDLPHLGDDRIGPPFYIYRRVLVQPGYRLAKA